MSKGKNYERLTPPQRLMVDYLRGNPNVIVRAIKRYYYIGRFINQSKGPYWVHENPMWPYSSGTIKELILKGVLITELNDKEFEVQVALGTMQHRIYKLAEKYKGN